MKSIWPHGNCSPGIAWKIYLAPQLTTAAAPTAPAKARLSNAEMVQAFRRAGWDDNRISVLIGYSGWNGSRDVRCFLDGRSEGTRPALRRGYQKLIGAPQDSCSKRPPRRGLLDEDDDDDDDF